MTDIDFDELDRAVNSVLSDNEVKPVPTVAPAPVPTPSAPAGLVTPEPTVPRETPQLNRVSFAPKQRSSGRFMDVVHPSSDMRGNTPLKPSVGKTIEPPVQEVASPSVDISKPETASVVMPDPIDVHEQKLAGEIPEIPSAQISEPENAETPTDSPFLAGAKVDKRPLGAFSQTESAVAELPPLETPLNLKPEIDEDHPIETDTHLPAELQKDVLRIEGDSTTKDAVAAPAVVTPLAIPPQYKEQPSTTDKSSGSIYDTKEYHAALIHPAKNKSGWTTVLWIFLIIAIGAGIGVGAYFFMLAK